MPLFIYRILIPTFWISGPLLSIVCCAFCITCFSCLAPPSHAGDKPPLQGAGSTPAEDTGCRSCHAPIIQDDSHSFGCEQCHRGTPSETSKDKAHTALLAKPAHPENMATTCGKCHQEQVAGCATSLHFTLNNVVNLVRDHFGAQSEVDTLLDIPISDPLKSPLALADDLLRRKCLRCHPYSSGDDYALTGRGTGCAACHMEFTEGKPNSHTIIKTPTDLQCLSCHYANHVGFDYYGRYENDFHDGYRTPRVTRDRFDRPYGVEYHELAPDIHQQKGLACVDCHDGSQLMGSGQKVTCSSCHDSASEASNRLPDTVSRSKDHLLLTSKITGKQHGIPQLSHPAHRQYGDKVSCQVCHAQWSYNDGATHLLMSQYDDYDDWSALTVQSDSRTEAFLDYNLFTEEEELPPWMSDTITGEKRYGVWYQGYLTRRWEDMIIAKDSDGVIKVFRPILDLRLSALDDDEDVRFDNATGQGRGILPYTPHTTGPATIFYTHRFRKLLQEK